VNNLRRSRPENSSVRIIPPGAWWCTTRSLRARSSDGTVILSILWFDAKGDQSQKSAALETGSIRQPERAAEGSTIHGTRPARDFNFTRRGSWRRYSAGAIKAMQALLINPRTVLKAMELCARLNGELDSSHRTSPVKRPRTYRHKGPPLGRRTPPSSDSQLADKSGGGRGIRTPMGLAARWISSPLPYQLRLALRVQKNSYLQYSIRMAREVVRPA
jgi:hypothetical protein